MSSIQSNPKYPLCPYFISGCSSTSQNCFTIRCCTELKKFESRKDVVKVWKTYCGTSLFSNCPMYKNHVSLINAFDTEKVNNLTLKDAKTVGNYVETIFVNLSKDFPDLTKDYNKIYNSTLPHKLSYLGENADLIGQNDWTEADDLELLKLYSRGLTYKNISKSLCRSVGNITCRLKKLKDLPHKDYDKCFKARRAIRGNSLGSDSHWTPQQRKEIWTKHLSGLTMAKIGEDYGRSHQSISTLIKRIKEGKYHGELNWSIKELKFAYFGIHKGLSIEEISSGTKHDIQDCEKIITMIDSGKFPDLHYLCFPMTNLQPKEDDEKILALSNQGLGSTKIARILGGEWTASKVQYRLNKLKEW